MTDEKLDQLIAAETRPEVRTALIHTRDLRSAIDKMSDAISPGLLNAEEWVFHVIEMAKRSRDE